MLDFLESCACWWKSKYLSKLNALNFKTFETSNINDEDSIQVVFQTLRE